jgi:hypothetical protein
MIRPVRVSRLKDGWSEGLGDNVMVVTVSEEGTGFAAVLPVAAVIDHPSSYVPAIFHPSPTHLMTYCIQGSARGTCEALQLEPAHRFMTG